LAESILARSTLQRREAILIWDFQKSGWSGAEDVHFGENMTLTPVSVASDKYSNLAVPSVSFTRAPFSNQERVTVTAGITNKRPDPASNVAVALEVDGHAIESQKVNIGANASTSVTFQAFTLGEPALHRIGRAGTGSFPARKTLDFR